MSTDPIATYVAFLRGVNVGGKNKLPTRDLIVMFTLAGCEAVETYIQSGNVVFKAGAALAARIPTLIASGIEERFGYRVPVVVRTVEELRDVVGGNPFLSTGVDAERLHVAFLADVPEDDRAARLDPDHSPRFLCFCVDHPSHGMYTGPSHTASLRGLPGMSKIPIEQYFVQRLIENVKHVHGVLESREHGEPLDLGELATHLYAFADKIDDGSGQLDSLLKLYVTLGTKALVETLEAIALEAGVESVEDFQPWSP